MLPAASRPTSAHRAPRRRPVAVAALAVGLVIGAIGIAGCSADVPSQDELAEALVRSGLSEAVAECAAEAIVTTLSDDELATLVDRGSGGLPKDDPDRTDDAADTLRTAVSDCRTAGVDPGTTVEPEGSGPSGDVTTSTGG